MTFTLSRRNALKLAGGASLLMAAPAILRAQTPIKLRYGNAGNDTSLSNIFNKKLAEAVAAKSNGALSVEIFAGSLGGEQKLIESVQLGSLDMYNGAYTGTREYDILYSPAFFRDGVQAKAAMMGAMGEQGSSVLTARYDARMLGVGRLGGYNLMLSKPITSLAELKGMKIRAPQIEGCIAGLSHFGAIPTPIPFNEIYLALQQGIVDGVLTALSPGVAGKFFEVAKYVVEADFGYALDKQIIANAAWDELGAERQAILQDSFTAMEETDYFAASITGKENDIKTWVAANGEDAIIRLDASALAGELDALNQQLADDVYGTGTWEKVKAM